MKCPNCEKNIVRIERYKTTVIWEIKDGVWTMGALDNGTHFHLFCPDYDEYSKSQKHTCKQWGNDLSEKIEKIVHGEYRQR